MNLRQIRTKIKSINNVKKITRAMQLVSAIKMRKAQAAEVDGRPYRQTLETVISRIVPKIDRNLSQLLSHGDQKTGRELAIVISSNKGLCGSFHMNLDRYILKNINADNTDFIAVGKKGALFIGAIGGKVLADYSGPRPLTEVSAVFGLAVKKFLDGEYAKVTLVYNRFISTLRSETVKEQLLPVELRKELNNADMADKMQSEYLIEPSPQAIIDSLLKNYVEDRVRGAVISSEAVEHSSRMIAMKNATDNATDVIFNLTLLGNKVRQSKITSELLDMITAKESVEV